MSGQAKGEIWVTEDNLKIQTHYVALLEDHGFISKGFSDGSQALAAFRAGLRPDLLLLDIRMERMGGVDLIREIGPGELPPTIVISGEASITEALEAVKMGIQDFLEKPFSDERLLYAIGNCFDKVALEQKVARLESMVSERAVGESESWRKVLDVIERVAPTDARVLIRGESGTGKEVVAKTLHQQSNRARAPFVSINCSAFPAHLIEDELFGHVRGAFTDAKADKMGLFETAHGGTLFLDEIGDMELTLQARLLRILEDGKVRRIGSNQERQVDVRVLAATHRDLETMSVEGSFREDLYFRLASIPIDVPALRQRVSDIPLLTMYFLNEFCRTYGHPSKTVEPEVFQALQQYNWPGNIRELKNLCERLSIFAGGTVRREDLPSHIFKQANQSSGLLRVTDIRPMTLKDFKNQCEREYLEMMLVRHNWNFVVVAESLDIHRSHLHKKVTALGIHRPAK